MVAGGAVEIRRDSLFISRIRADAVGSNALRQHIVLYFRNVEATLSRRTVYY